MSRKRNIIEEIHQKRSRSGRLRTYTYKSRFNALDVLAKRLNEQEQEGDEELLRYIPVASIAIVESHFRDLYTLVIDTNTEYLSRAIEHIQKEKLRLDLDFLVALQGKQVTPGEIFSHILPLSSGNDIDRTLSALLDLPYLTTLKKVKSNLDFALDLQESRDNEEVVGAINSLSRMFLQRHIIAHEYAIHINLKKEEVLSDYENVKAFISYSDELVEKTLGVYVPPFQQAANQHALAEFEKKEEELDALISQLITTTTGEPYEFPIVLNKERFKAAIDKWKEFRETYAESYAAEFIGGTIYPLIYHNQLRAQTEFFIQNLKEEFKDFL